jgi:hypothetical protein
MNPNPERESMNWKYHAGIQKLIMTNKEEDPKIYIILSSTYTMLGKSIRLITHYKYNHVSLAFNPDLKIMYSFARYCHNNPLVGGFVEESSYRYFFHNKNNKIAIKVFEITISKNRLDEIKNCINKMNQNSDQYIYNTFSTVFHVFHKTLRINNSYTCIDFINKILQLGNVIENEEAAIASISEIDALLGMYCVYEGFLPHIRHKTGWGKDIYFKKDNKLYICKSTVVHFGKLIRRLVFC